MKAIDWLHDTRYASKRDDVLETPFFDIARIGKEWMLWRFTGNDDDKELIVLTDEAMDMLRDYFAEQYAEDRANTSAGAL